MAKQRRGRWVEFVKRHAGDSVLYTNVARMPYEKGRHACIELSETDDDGQPIILKYPPESYDHIRQPHLRHPGMEERDGKAPKAETR